MKGVFYDAVKEQWREVSFSNKKDIISTFGDKQSIGLVNISETMGAFYNTEAIQENSKANMVMALGVPLPFVGSLLFVGRDGNIVRDLSDDIGIAELRSIVIPLF